MKRLLALALIFASWPALAQWQVPEHATPVGRGPGVTGFKSVGPCAAGVPIVGGGTSADPSCSSGGAFTGFANPSAQIAGPAINGSATTAMRSDAVPTFATAQTTAHTWAALQTFNASTSSAIFNNGTVTINPTAASITRGLFINQTLPTSATAVGSNDINEILWQGGPNLGPAGQALSGLKLWGLNGGTNAQGNIWNFWSELNYSTASTQNGDHIAVLGRATQSVANSGFGGLYGGDFQSILFSGANTSEAKAIEAGIQVNTGASATWRFAVGAVAQGGIQGSSLDGAYEIGNADPVAAFQNALFLNAGHGSYPLNTTGSVIGADAVAQTIGCVICLPNYTVATNIFNLKHFVATGAGVLTLDAYGAGLLHSSAGGAITSSAVNMAADVTGTLPYANGGTNATSQASAIANLRGASIVSAPTTVDFSVAGDNLVTILLPTGFTRYKVTDVVISNASADISAATAGVFTATGGGGVAIVTGASVITVTTASDNTLNNTQSMTINAGGTESYTAGTLKFRVSATAASGRTAKITIVVAPIS